MNQDENLAVTQMNAGICAVCANFNDGHWTTCGDRPSAASSNVYVRELVYRAIYPMMPKCQRVGACDLLPFNWHWYLMSWNESVLCAAPGWSFRRLFMQLGLC